MSIYLHWHVMLFQFWVPKNQCFGTQKQCFLGRSCELNSLCLFQRETGYDKASLNMSIYLHWHVMLFSFWVPKNQCFGTQNQCFLGRSCELNSLCLFQRETGYDKASLNMSIYLHWHIMLFSFWVPKHWFFGTQKQCFLGRSCELNSLCPFQEKQVWQSKYKYVNIPTLTYNAFLILSTKESILWYSKTMLFG